MSLFPSLGFEFLMTMPMPLPCLGQGNGCKKQHLMGHSVQNLGGSNMDEHGREFMQRLSRHMNHHLSICQFAFRFAFLCNFLFFG